MIHVQDDADEAKAVAEHLQAQRSADLRQVGRQGVRQVIEHQVRQVHGRRKTYERSPASGLPL